LHFVVNSQSLPIIEEIRMSQRRPWQECELVMLLVEYADTPIRQEAMNPEYQQKYVVMPMRIDKR
jgi:hypothetical protein